MRLSATRRRTNRGVTPRRTAVSLIVRSGLGSGGCSATPSFCSMPEAGGFRTARATNEDSPTAAPPQSEPVIPLIRPPFAARSPAHSSPCSSPQNPLGRIVESSPISLARMLESTAARTAPNRPEMTGTDLLGALSANPAKPPTPGAHGATGKSVPCIRSEVGAGLGAVRRTNTVDRSVSL
jgi:hypothetical protein